MSEIDDGGFAFPSIDEEEHQGMTLRAWLAGQALSGYNANEGLTMESSVKIGTWAVEDADATINALNTQTRAASTGLGEQASGPVSG